MDKFASNIVSFTLVRVDVNSLEQKTGVSHISGFRNSELLAKPAYWNIALAFFFAFLSIYNYSASTVSPCRLQPCYQKARKWLIKNITSVLVFGVCIGVVQVDNINVFYILYIHTVHKQNVHLNLVTVCLPFRLIKLGITYLLVIMCCKL